MNIITNKVRHKIQEEFGDENFCVLVDEALDEYHKKQIGINLLYVDCDGFTQECFFEIVNWWNKGLDFKKWDMQSTYLVQSFS